MKEISYGPGMSMYDPPVITKLGIVSDGCEMTPFVRSGRLLRCETVTKTLDVEHYIFDSHCVIRDVISNEQLSPDFAHGRHFFSAYEENGRVYVFGTTEQENRCWGGSQIHCFVSDDLIHWEERVALDMPGWEIYNTSVCRGPDGYVMAFEAGKPAELVGRPFTEFFAVSKDLVHWEPMDFSCCYTTERYCACPTLRWSRGWYYLVCLEELPLQRYAPYIYRTKDFSEWHIALHEPLLMPSPEDRMLALGARLSPEVAKRALVYLNINNCDVDFCEYHGRTYINYLTGDQLGYGVMCAAEYKGGLDDFLEGWFR